MNDADPVASLLAELDGSIAPRPRFAEALRVRLLAELAGERPARVARPIAVSAPPRRRGRLRATLISIALLLVLASAAMATYAVVNDTGGGTPSLIGDSSNSVASLSAMDAEGRTWTVWQCPHGVFCGTVTSVAWSRDGRQFALALNEVGAHSPYPGLHVIDAVTGRDTKLFGLSDLLVSPAGTDAHQRAANRAWNALIAKFGCSNPEHLAWSPDGSKIAYVCEFGGRDRALSQIHIVDADGRHPRLLRTGTANAAWPTWSPTGSRIAFSTASTPLTKVRSTDPHWKRFRRSAIYTVGLDGRDPRRIALGAAPSWSPDGTAIAYRSTCGGRVRLVAPDGRDLTPADGSARCPGLGPSGWPAWAPDGSRIAIGTSSALYLVDADGGNLEPLNAPSVVGSLQPVWQPAQSG